MGEVTRTAVRILTFRASRDELVALDDRHLAFGLVCTWIVGMGRWWDDPGAHFVQHFGLGSVIYVFALAALLWLLIRPLNPHNFGFRHLLTYVSLTAPPAILYALPVERWMDLDAARSVNVWFLAIVASWRVALLFVYLRRVFQFDWARLTVAMLLPLCVIVTALTMLNLERAVFNVMSGIREEGSVDPSTSNDAAYEILFGLSILSICALPILLMAYFVMITKDVRQLIQSEEEPNPPKS